MRNRIHTLLILLSTALFLFSCEEDIPQEEINNSVNSDFLQGKWFISTVTELGGSYSTITTDKDGNLLEENTDLHYVINSQTISSPLEINFELNEGKGTLQEFGSFTIDYSVFSHSDLRTTYNEEEALPQRNVTNVNSEGDDDREQLTAYNARLEKELKTNYSSLFANKAVNEKSFSVELVDESTIRLSYTALVTQEDDSVLEVPATLDLEILFASDSMIRLKYKTSKNTISFGGNILKQTFEIGEDLPWSTPYFLTEKIINPQHNNYTGEVELLFTRGKVITDEVLDNFNNLSLNIVQKDTDGNLIIEVNNPLQNFEPTALLESLTYETESGEIIELSNPRFEEGSNNLIIKIDAAKDTNEIVSLTYNDTFNVLIDHYGKTLDSFSSPLFPFNFFRGTFHDFSNSNQYTLDENVNFGYWNSSLAPGNQSEILIVNDVPDDALDSNVISLQYKNTPATSDVLAWSGGSDLILEEGTYRILFHAKSTEPISLGLILPNHWCKTYKAKLKDSSDNLTLIGSEWTEYEIGPFTLDNSILDCPNTDFPEGRTNMIEVIDDEGNVKGQAKFVFRFGNEGNIYEEYTALFHDFRLNLVESKNNSNSVETSIE